MAITKMWEITERLDNSINYIINKKKTENEDSQYVTCFNCNQNDPYHSMMQTKESFHKMNMKRIGFHAVQSFAPGEGTPEMIHEIGVRLATELFGDRYEFVVATHMDKDYLHNHIIINSTSFVDGKQFTNSKKDRARMIEVSDRLCREYGLSVIEDPQLSFSNNKRPYKLRRFMEEIKKDMDEAIIHSYIPQNFKNYMMMEGYEFKTVKGIPCIQHPSCRYPIPLKSLGKNYQKEEINKRILDSGTRDKKKFNKHQDLYERFERNELKKGLLSVYVIWMVLIGILPDYNIKKTEKLSKEMRKEIKHIDEISNEVTLMQKFEINTIEDLNSVRTEFKNEYDQLVNLRNDCRKESRKTKDLVDKTVINEKAKSYTPRIRELRKKIRMLDNIETRSVELQRQNELLSLKENNKRKAEER